MQTGTKPLSGYVATNSLTGGAEYDYNITFGKTFTSLPTVIVGTGILIKA